MIQPILLVEVVVCVEIVVPDILPQISVDRLVPDLMLALSTAPAECPNSAL